MPIFDFLRAGSEEDRFAKQVMRRLRDHGWSEGIQYDRDHFALTLGTGRRMFLRNVFRDWSAAPAAEKSAQLDRAIAFVFEPGIGDAFEQALPSLLPAIRSRTNLANQWLDPALGMEENWYDGALKPFCDSLAIVAAIDQPTSVGFVNRRQLSKWSRSLDEVLAIAISNLAERSPSRFERIDGGLYVSSFEDYYDASRLLIPRLFEGLPLRGVPVAIAASRSGVVVADSQDPDALNAMAVFVEDRSRDETRPISNLPLVLRNGEWQLFDCSNPDLAALDRLRAMQWLQDYADQKALLDPYFERIGRDVYVAKLSGTRDGERIRSWTTWTSEAVSLLPEADAVALVRGGTPRMVRRWSDVVEKCGPLKLEAGLYPRRYLVESGPDDAAWERLGRCDQPSWLPAIDARP
jgi:hypothetical protein